MDVQSPRVLLADDHPRVADAFGEYLAEAFELVGNVRNGDLLIEAAKTLQPDVIVTDISMPGTDGLRAMRRIQQHLPHTKVILLSSYVDDALVRYALAAGASGFVLKTYASTELVPAIRAVLAGGTYVSRALASVM